MWKPCGLCCCLGCFKGFVGFGTLGPCATPRCTAGPAPLPWPPPQVPGAGSDHWLEDHLEDHLKSICKDRHILECHLGSRLGGVDRALPVEVQQLKSFTCYGYKPPHPHSPNGCVCPLFDVHLDMSILPWQRVATTATGAMRPGEKHDCGESSDCSPRSSEMCREYETKA